MTHVAAGTGTRQVKAKFKAVTSGIFWLVACFAIVDHVHGAEWQTLKIVAANQPISWIAGIVAADHRGLFTLQKLNIVVDTAPNSASQITPTKDTVYLLSARQLLEARANGSPLVAFAANSIDNPAIIYSKSLEFRSPQDLLGKTVGYAQDKDASLAFESLLEKNGVSRASIRELPNCTIADLASGKIDALVGTIGGKALSSDLVLTAQPLDLRAFGVHLPGSYYASTEEMLRNSPDSIIRFIRAVAEGWDDVYSDVGKAANLVSSYEPTSEPSLIRDALVRQRDYIRPAGQRFGDLSKLKLSELSALMLRRRLLLTSVDLSRAIDERIISEAYRRKD